MGKVSKILIIAVTAALGLAAFFSHTTLAASATGFKAGQIMDDTVMTHSGSMTVAQIQNFLNSKVPTCDTNGTQSAADWGYPNLTHAQFATQVMGWPGPPYTCLRNYKQNNLSAAQIIYNTAQQYNVNPEVLIVLLQKESSLVTDTWPLPSQYKTAAGYGCPDGAPCDSQYFGLTNQLTWAAKLYHSVLTQDPNWYSPYFVGSNPKVYWNPSSSCGYAPLSIVNWTTASLYDYTPYRPNQAALNAGYGNGDSCSSYGNRNFYLYFTDWFGSTTNTLFKIKGTDNTVYLSWGSIYYPISSPEILRAYGLSGIPVSTLDSSQLSDSTEGPMLSRVVKFGTDATVYLVDNGALHPIPSWGALAQYGLSSGDMVNYSDTNLQYSLESGSSLYNFARSPDGSIYYMSNGKKHLFPDSKTYSSVGPSLAASGANQYTNFSSDFINSLSSGTPVLLDGSTVQSSDSAAIYLYDKNSLLMFTPDSWAAWGHKLDYKFSPNNTKLTDSAITGVVPTLITDGSTYYLVQDGKKYTISPATQTTWGLTSDKFTAVSANGINRLSSGGQLTDNLIRTPDGTVYVIKNGKRDKITSTADFNGLGYSWNQVFNIDNPTANIIPVSGTIAFAPGSLIRTPDGAVSWIDTDLKAYTIPSMDAFNDFGFNWKNVRNYPQGSLTGYTLTSLKTLLATDSNYYLVTKGQKYTVDTNTYSTYNFTSTPNTSVSDTLLSDLKGDSSLTQFIQGSDATVYKVVNGQKKAFTTPTSFYAQGGSWDKVTHVSNEFLASIPTGSSY